VEQSCRCRCWLAILKGLLFWLPHPRHETGGVVYDRQSTSQTREHERAQLMGNARITSFPTESSSVLKCNRKGGAIKRMDQVLMARRRKTGPLPPPLPPKASALSRPKGTYGLTFTQSANCDNELDAASGVFTFRRSTLPSFFIRIEEAARNYCTPHEAVLGRETPLSCWSILQFVIQTYLKFSMTSE
jgi:hypothetical protein